VLVPIARRHTRRRGRSRSGRSPYAPVATPLRWDEVTRTLDPREHNLRTVPERVAELGDIHEPLLHGRQSLEIRTRIRHN
jgi:DNA primase